MSPFRRPSWLSPYVQAASLSAAGIRSPPFLNSPSHFVHSILFSEGIFLLLFPQTSSSSLHRRAQCREANLQKTARLFLNFGNEMSHGDFFSSRPAHRKVSRPSLAHLKASQLSRCDSLAAFLLFTMSLLFLILHQQPSQLGFHLLKRRFNIFRTHVYSLILP